MQTNNTKGGGGGVQPRVTFRVKEQTAAEKKKSSGQRRSEICIRLACLTRGTPSARSAEAQGTEEQRRKPVDLNHRSGFFSELIGVRPSHLAIRTTEKI